jgi:hypothetical protein
MFEVFDKSDKAVGSWIHYGVPERGFGSKPDHYEPYMSSKRQKTSPIEDVEYSDEGDEYED